jgi:hypothetical protein
MKKVLIHLVVALFIAPLSLFAQTPTTHPHSCGTSIETQQTMLYDMMESRARYPNYVASRAVAYIPVWFHMVAKTDGTGRTNEANVAELLCEWNKIYAANGLEMQFYIKGFSKIDLDALYNAPQSFAGTNRMLTTKKTDAMNIYLVNNAGDGSNPNEVVLAYYSNGGTYNNDWIACTNGQVNASGAYTIAHEAGHFFTLAHTFYGWETTTPPTGCAPASVNYGGNVVAVEKAARSGATKNCDYAADGFCDTPPDYFFGFGFNGCTWNGTAKDPDCMPVDPDETNIMSYFLSCLRNFSTEQKNAITTNYNTHVKRAYLRSGNITPPLTPALTTLVAPATGSTTTYFNNINLDWSDVPNALGYQVEVSRFSSFAASKSFYLTTSELNLNATNAGTSLPTAPSSPPNLPTTIYWRVKTIVPYNNCNNLASGSFQLGLLNAVNDIAGVSNFTVSPNPLSKSQALSLQMSSEKAFDAKVKLMNITGQVVKSESRAFAAGYSEQTISVSDLSNGTYILSVESANGVLNKRIVIQ